MELIVRNVNLVENARNQFFLGWVDIEFPVIGMIVSGFAIFENKDRKARQVFHRSAAAHGRCRETKNQNG
jgi:hypothetical protein